MGTEIVTAVDVALNFTVKQYNVPELLPVSRKNFQVSRFPEKSPDSQNNFGFVQKQCLLELTYPVNGK